MEFSELERDALLIRAAMPADLEAHPDAIARTVPTFDEALLAWLGFRSQAEARARLEAIDRAPESYQNAVTDRVFELDDREDDRRGR